jgi:cell division protein FtsB
MQARRRSRCRCPGYPADAMKFIAAALLVVLVLLQYRLWLGDGSVREVMRLHDQISAQEQRNARLAERNRTLAAEVQDLKKGMTAIEERARTDLGMVGKSETFYQVVAPEDAPVAAGAGAPAP